MPPQSSQISIERSTHFATDVLSDLDSFSSNNSLDVGIGLAAQKHSGSSLLYTTKSSEFNLEALAHSSQDDLQPRNVRFPDIDSSFIAPESKKAELISSVGVSTQEDEFDQLINARSSHVALNALARPKIVREPGNTSKLAKPIRLTNAVQVFKDSVGDGDRFDFYRFNLRRNSSFSLNLTGRKNSIDIELLNRSGQPVELSRSLIGRNYAIRGVLDAGTYYVKVIGRASDTAYRLSMTKDPGGTRRTAQPLTLRADTKTIKNTVGGGDRADCYRFDLNTQSSLGLRLEGLRHNADITLLNNLGQVMMSSRRFGRRNEVMKTTLESGTYYVRVLGFDNSTPYNLSLSATAVPRDPRRFLTGEAALNSGMFTVGESGEVSFDYLLDGSPLQGELAVFNLRGMEQYKIGSKRYMQEAALRALGNSADSGYVVILDKTEGARFTANPRDPNFNAGKYRGVKTFEMNPGDKFGIMLVPNGTVPDALLRSNFSGDQRPLFSVPAANLYNAAQFTQVVEVRSDSLNQVDSNIFSIEDVHLSKGADCDYNDLIFQVRGATGGAPLLNQTINPSRDWRSSEVGQRLVNYADLQDNGLTGRYYDNPDFTNYRGRRTDASVNFDWGLSSPAVMTSPDTFSVSWTGQVEPLYSEVYTFYTQSDERVKLWVNGQLLINNWADHALTEDSSAITLNAGQKYDIKLEYAENDENAAMKLFWSSTSQLKEIIPQNLLYPDPTALPLDPTNGLEYRPGEILVKFQANASDEEIQSFAQAYGANRVERLVPFNSQSISVLDQWRILGFAPDIDVPKIRDAIAQDTSIESVELDYTIEFDWGSNGVPNDSSFGQLWGLDNIAANTVDKDIDAPEAWQIQKGSRDVIVGVLDSGVDYNHPDLAANIWTNPIDGTRGYDFGDNDSDPMDDSVLIKDNKLIRGHGTHVAGTIGAVGDNNLGIVGVSPYVSIMPLKLADSEGNGFRRNAARAIHYAISNGARILNASFAGPSPNFWARFVSNDAADEFSSMADAIRASNDSEVLFVAAAGNNAKDINERDDRQFPAGFSLLPNVITVAATDSNDNLTGFSNYGSIFVNLAAPGQSILSTVPSSVDPSGYKYLDGTSMAAPHVAGAAALLLAQDKIQSAKQLKDALIGTVDTLPSLEGKVSSGGRLNAYKALLSLPINRQVEVVIDYVRGVGGFGEKPDFFVKVATDGINFVTKGKDGEFFNDYDITPKWRFPSPPLDNTQSTALISIQLWEDDDGFRFEDNKVDINPGQNKKEWALNLSYDLTTNVIRDRDTGVIYTADDNGQVQLTGGGRKADDVDGNAEIWFTINDSVVP